MKLDFLFILLALLLGSVGSIGLAALIMLLKDEVLEKVSLYLTYLAGGTLLGAAFLGLIPEALTMQTAAHVLPMILIGILFFFLLEKMILWHTCRNKNCERQIHAAAPMILIGDAFHNAIDGIVITASFLSSPSMGVFVTLSTMLHEIPQELGDFGILLNSGMPKKKALGYNILSGCSAILLGVLAYFFLKELQSIIPYVLAFSAASFLYISLAELIPEMHKKTTFKESVSQILLIVAGILLIFFLKD